MAKMDDQMRTVLQDNYEMLWHQMYEVHASWLEGDLTTGQAIEQQRVLREQMREIRELLTAEADGEDAS
jgi:hypothetical protein